ncbi:hypothetical protein DMA11_01985 [Marinilabiliaceae bacterium JC017]|nr:hypothetical protein DMA11_01985 [Marinilabiliaceae bacterium JC017]
MNKKQSNKLDAYMNVKGVLNANRSITEPYPILIRVIDDFFALVANIKAISTDTTVDTSGVTEQKSAIKERLAVHTSELAASASAFATDQGDIAMEAMLDFTYSDIRYARDNEAINIASVVAKELEKYDGELVDYLISDEDQSLLTTLIDQFQDVTMTKGNQRSQGVSDTKKLALLFRETDELLTKKLDRLLMRMRSKAPAFYDSYLNARSIIDL